MTAIVALFTALAAWLGLSWAVGLFFKLRGLRFYLCFGLLALLGMAACAFIYWMIRKGKIGRPAKAGALGKQAASGADPEIDGLIREAEQRLAASRTTQGAGVGNLPAVFLIGDQGTAKTTTMVQSGLEPELVCGQVYRDTTVVPTRSANVWLARQTLWVEAGGALIQQPQRWVRLIRRLAPGKLKSVVGAGAQAPRAAVVAVDAEGFIKPGAAEAMTVLARNLNARLGEISQHLGISFPVYVLFTRTDRLPFFLEYVRNLSSEESGQVCGATVPMRGGAASGVWAEEQTRLLAELFDGLYFSLADKRILLLPRENDPAKLPGAYEFPREFRKLRGPLVEFLVNLCRPSQLRVSPFLRGFYFSGVRPVFVTDVAAAPQAPQPMAPQAYPSAAGATQVFKAGTYQQAPQPVSFGQPGGVRKAPQWVFLTRLFHDVFLGDREALAASGASTKTSLMQRILLGLAAFLFFVFTIGFTVSFFGNRSLATDALAAARAIRAVPMKTADALPTPDALDKLETLRRSLDQLARFEKDGAPFRLRWFLYAGGEMYPEVRRLYCQGIGQLLVNPARNAMLQAMSKLPPNPSPADDFGAAFTMLKAYLIATVYPEHSSGKFLAPVLQNYWLNGRDADPVIVKRAGEQFDYFGDFLRDYGACPCGFDGETVARARRYLAQFSGIDSIYQAMLTEASRRNKPVNFNRDFKGSEVAVVNSRDVAGAFTRAGWAAMMEFIKNPDQFFGGDKWVLCGDPARNADTGRVPCGPGAMLGNRADLARQLTDRYTADYIKQWRAFLRNSSLVRYASLADAAQKLDLLSGNTTPLMALMWVATQNTWVESDTVKGAFQPVQEVVPPPATLVKYIYEDKNGKYIDVLMQLQKTVSEAAERKEDAGAAQRTLEVAGEARMAMRQVSRRFNPDQDGQVDQTVAKLLEDPITQVERLLRGAGRDELNAKGGGACKQFSILANRFPFNPKAQAEASLDEVAKFFRPPAGTLWDFYEKDLKKYLKKEGNVYVPAPDPSGAVTLNPAFVRFFNDAARFAEAVYPGGAAQPGLKYSLTGVLSDQVTEIALTIDGQSIRYTGKPAPKQFTWPGGAKQEAKLVVKLAGGSELEAQDWPGLWAVFRFFADANSITPAGGMYTLTWLVRQGQSGRVMQVGGRDLAYSLVLDTGGMAPVFSKDFLNNLRCVSQVAK